VRRSCGTSLIPSLEKFFVLPRARTIQIVAGRTIHCSAPELRGSVLSSSKRLVISPSPHTCQESAPAFSLCRGRNLSRVSQYGMRQGGPALAARLFGIAHCHPARLVRHSRHFGSKPQTIWSTVTESWSGLPSSRKSSPSRWYISAKLRLTRQLRFLQIRHADHVHAQAAVNIRLSLWSRTAGPPCTR